MSSNASPSFERYHHLERSWDPQVTHPGPPPHAWKANPNPDPNLKNLVINKRLPAVQSAKTLPTRTTIDSTCSTTPSAYNSIAATFGFSHHGGTDRHLELQVLKSILKRESALTNLQETCTPKHTNKIFLQNNAGTGVLDQLTSIRDLTVALVEAVVLWRQSMVNSDPEIPRPFMYENQNYLLKLIFDMDFLADITPLVEALGLEGEKLRSNPLMLPESLDPTNLGKSPEESARDDANGETNSKLYLERLKLRGAEQVLLREMNFNRQGAPSVAWEEDNTETIVADSAFRESTTFNSSATNTSNDTKARQADILSWYRQAQLQLIKLEEGIGEKLSANYSSTGRLQVPVPEEEPLIKMSYSPSKMIAPTPLHEHNSTMAAVPLPGPRSRSPSPTRSGGIRKLKRLPDQQESSHLAIANLAPSLEWSHNDIQLLLELEQVPRCVALACASTLILLASGPRIPSKISWETFCEVAHGAAIENDMNAIVPSQIPQFKIRAINPFLGSLNETFEEDLNSDDPNIRLEAGNPKTEIIRKLVTWVVEVLKIATTTVEPATSTSRVTTSQSLIDSIKSRRLESSISVKRKQAIERAKCPSDMKVKHTETSENELLKGATITISLEVPKKKAPTNTKRYFIKVFDENTFQHAQVPVNCKEYSSYLLDLREVFPDEDLELYFEPCSAKWWAKYIKEVATVTINEGVLCVRVSKKAIRNIISNQIKTKDAEDDSDLVKQDDEMASQQPLKKEKSTEKKKKPTAKERKEAAAAAAKAKEMEAKKQEEQAQRERTEKAKKKKAEAYAKRKAEEDAANKRRAEEEERKRLAEEEAARKKKEGIAAKQRADEEAAAKKKADEKIAVAKRELEIEEARKEEEKAKKEEEHDDNDDEYDAEYDDENFVMTPKGCPQKKDNVDKESNNKVVNDEEGDDEYGDEYDDDNYDDESASKAPKSTQQEKSGDNEYDDDDDYGDDDYEASFEEEE